MARLGIVLYWVATAIAIALVVLAILAYFTAKGSGALEGAPFIVAYASLVWLIGSAILYLLARRWRPVTASELRQLGDIRRDHCQWAMRPALKVCDH